MADDIKSLSKKNTELEKRLKFAEAKIKILADSMTSPKDIEKYLNLLEVKIEKDTKKEILVSQKAQGRAAEVASQAIDAVIREQEKDRKKENQQQIKDFEKMQKEAIRRTEFNIMLSRIATLEAMVAGLSRR